MGVDSGLAFVFSHASNITGNEGSVKGLGKKLLLAAEVDRRLTRVLYYFYIMETQAEKQMKNTAHATKRKQSLRSLKAELIKRSHCVTDAGDYSIQVDECLTIVVYCSRSTAQASEADESLLFISVVSIDRSLPGVLAYVENKLTEVQQMSRKQIPTTWKGMRYTDDNPKPVKRTWVDPNELPPAPDKSVPRYKQLKRNY